MSVELSARAVARLVPGRHCVARNLYLDNDPPPGSWSLLYVSPVLGRRVTMGLGSAADLSVPMAKEIALEHRLVILKGRCPLSERRAAEAARKQVLGTKTPTFRAVFDLYLGAHEASWRNPKHRAQWSATIGTYALPVIGDMAVNKIGTAEVMLILEPIWRAKPETASRVRGRVEAVLDYAGARHWRSGDNPARWRGHLAKLLPGRQSVKPEQHHAAVPWRELPALYQRLAGQADISALALRYTLLTALRTNEVLGILAKGEIDYAAKVHTVPAERTKARRIHRTPLSDEALAVLADAEARRTGPFLFNGARLGTALSNMAMLEKLRGLYPGATVHGTVRSGFRDWCAENGISRELAETALAHVVKDKTEAAYLRNDLLEPRRAVMRRWARFLTALAAASGKVVALGKPELAAAR